MVGAAVGGHHPVELILGATFQIAQMFAVGHKAAFGERRVNTLAIGEQQRVADVEEDGSDSRVHDRCRPSLLLRSIITLIITLAAGDSVWGKLLDELN